MSKSKIKEIVCIYDSQSSFISRAYALLGRKVFSRPCSLSDLTMVGLKPNPDWEKFVANFPAPIQCVHSDQAGSDLFYTIRGKTPCVVARCDHNQSILLLSSDNLASCQGDIEQFQLYLRTAIDAKFITL